MMISTKKLVGLMTVSLAVGIAVAMIIASVWGGFLGENGSGGAGDAEQGHEGHDHGAEAAEEDTYYTCPMHPSVICDSSGACPVCGMDLVEKKKGGYDMDP